MSAPNYYLLPRYDDEESEGGASATTCDDNNSDGGAPINMPPNPTGPSTAQESTEPAYQTFDERMPAIPAHPALKAGGTTLSITLDFTPPPKYYYTTAFSEWRSALLSTLPQYRNLSSKIFIALIYPLHSTQSFSLKRTQREVFKSVVEIIGKWPVTGISAIEVVFKSPEMEWSQIQALVPMYGLKYTNWVCHIKQGATASFKLKIGHDWDVRLKGLYRKEKMT